MARYTLESNGDVPRASGAGQGGDRRGLLVRRARAAGRRRAAAAARRPRAGRVAGGPSAGRGAHPARQPRVARRGAHPRPLARGRRLLRGRLPLRVRRQVARRARLRETSSLAGGFTDWKRNGYPFTTPRTPERRAARSLLAPHPDSRGRRGGPAEAARRPRAPDRRRRARLAVVALPRRGGRRHARHRRRRRRRRLEPAAPDRALHGHARRAEGAVGEARDRGAQPRRQGAHLRGAADLRERRADPRRRLGRDRRRRRQLPHALPRQRRLRLARHPGRPRLDLPLRGPGDGLPSPRRAVLPLPLSRAAAAGDGAELRRGRRARRPARASSARSRRARRSSSSSAPARRSPGACSSSTRSTRPSTR